MTPAQQEYREAEKAVHQCLGTKNRGDLAYYLDVTVWALHKQSYLGFSNERWRLLFKALQLPEMRDVIHDRLLERASRISFAAQGISRDEQEKMLAAARIEMDAMREKKKPPRAAK